MQPNGCSAWAEALAAISQEERILLECIAASKDPETGLHLLPRKEVMEDAAIARMNRQFWHYHTTGMSSAF